MAYPSALANVLLSPQLREKLNSAKLCTPAITGSVTSQSTEEKAMEGLVPERALVARLDRAQEFVSQ